MLSDIRQREVVRRLWLQGPLSRSELHRRTGMTPNGVGNIVDALIKQGLVRECGPEPSSGGRPPVPVDLDPNSRFFVGLAIAPGQIEIGRLGLRGQIFGTSTAREITDPRKMVAIARQMLEETVTRQSLAIGISVTGFVDPAAREILFSSAVADMGKVSIAPLYETAGNLPIVLENDLHATAARWMLTHRTDDRSDLLIVGFDDGGLGAAMLIDGKPNRGCVTASNELGHTRFPIETAMCYCGHTGCLERICSTDFLIRCGAPADASLLHSAMHYRGNDVPLETLVTHLAAGLANACNFVRPNRLVLVSRLVRFPEFTDLLIRKIRGQLMEVMADRIQIDLWDQPANNSAETAGWLALANLYGSWSATGDGAQA